MLRSPAVRAEGDTFGTNGPTLCAAADPNKPGPQARDANRLKVAGTRGPTPPGAEFAPFEDAPAEEVVGRSAESRAAQAPFPSSRQGKRRRDRSRLLRLLLLFLVGMLTICSGAEFAWHWWSVGRFLEATNDAYVHSDISTVSAKVEGYIREVVVQDNDPVRRGDIIAVIDDRDFSERVVQALSRLQAQRAVVAGINARIARQEAVIEQAGAALEGVEAVQRKARAELVRYQALARQDIVSRQKLEAAQAEAAQAEAAVQKARAVLTGERRSIAPLEAERDQGEAVLAEAEAAHELSRIDLANTVVRAPIDGVVGNRAAQVGQLARPGVALLAIVPARNVYVIANFKETQIARMRPGQTAEIEADAWPGRRIEGKVQSFAPATGSLFSLLPPENAAGNFTKVVQRLPTKIAVPVGDPSIALLRPGLSVTVSVDTRGEVERKVPSLASAIASAFGLLAVLPTEAQAARLSH